MVALLWRHTGPLLWLNNSHWTVKDKSRHPLEPHNVSSSRAALYQRHHETTFNVTDPTADRTITLPDATGTVLTTGNSDTPTRQLARLMPTLFLLTRKRRHDEENQPANLGITAGAASTDDATALAIALG